MRPDILDQLGAARDFHALTKSVLTLCEPYGPVHAFRLVHNRGSARVACLVELESPKQQPALARALGGRTLNGAVTLDIPVARDFGKMSAPQASLPHAKVVVIPQPVPRVANSGSSTQASA